jgi:proteasome lid subunit RPN8/RPN11
MVCKIFRLRAAQRESQTAELGTVGELIMPIELGREDLKRLEQHAAMDYPNECCGILVGKVEGARTTITAVFPVKNARQDSARNRYLIQPEDVMAAQSEAEKLGAEIVGFYHSHPDQPSKPSGFDSQSAWPWFAYVIVAVAVGVPGETTAWIMAMDRSGFLPEEIIHS